MPEPFVQVDNLTKRFGDLLAVNGVSFEIGEGEIFGLLGPNGAGKTTTISMLSCLLDIDGGSARIGGYDVGRNAMAVKRLIGIVPQDLAIYPMLPAIQNLRFFGSIYGLHGKELNERIDHALEIVGLKDRAKDKAESFSGGMKRRLNLAAGLLHRPKILFLDEPTVGVDPQSRNHIFENIRRLQDDGMTILYTTHYMEEAQSLCERVAIVDQGEVIAMDAPESLIRQHGEGIIEFGVREVSDETLARIESLETVRGARRNGETLRVESPSANHALLEVLPALEQAGVAIESLAIREPNLESVFLHLTGKSLRD
ncbi:ATP-binding cassette domain-containing protein [bacterium]|nr:ATP-binding cassette domain-containing protein [bacterium]